MAKKPHSGRGGDPLSLDMSFDEAMDVLAQPVNPENSTEADPESDSEDSQTDQRQTSSDD